MQGTHDPSHDHGHVLYAPGMRIALRWYVSCSVWCPWQIVPGGCGVILGLMDLCVLTPVA